MRNFSVKTTSLVGAYVIDCMPHEDCRGLFSRWFCSEELSAIIGERKIVNVNFSRTVRKGSIRGMHFQKPPYSEMKIVRCIKGRIIDTIVDIREKSETFLEHFSVELSDENMKMLVVPEGFAHGFQTLEDDCEIMYLVTEHYNRSAEGGLRYSDPRLGICWSLPISDISDKDANHELIGDDYKGVSL
ncbi:MAG: dTDP-4-dehydrorhamnose 3,5-epimerase family protein [Candidatus Cloacimonetes bacterium]|nr:dTDP-4-dehydrorhamnose 3,5-epimerase family protein [Candidatus Cloacimonadota bacterium]MDY0230472.1 dTDP-4-dehydrorhamnose 3,5-epimerase family protein [Candidatus Cloacimonadaceae bacterium]